MKAHNAWTHALFSYKRHIHVRYLTLFERLDSETENPRVQHSRTAEADEPGHGAKPRNTKGVQKHVSNTGQQEYEQGLACHFGALFGQVQHDHCRCDQRQCEQRIRRGTL